MTRQWVRDMLGVMRSRKAKRRNPITKFASLAYRDHPEAMREMKKSKKKYTFAAATRELSRKTGKGLEEIRGQGLKRVSNYVRSHFVNASDALEYLNLKNRRLGIWCACAVAHEGLRFIPSDARPIAERSIKAAAGWVRGTVNASSVSDAANAAWNQSYLMGSSSAESAMKAASRVASASAYAGAYDRRSAIAASSLETAMVATEIADAVEFSGQSNAQELHRLVSIAADAVLTFPIKQRQAKKATKTKARRNPVRSFSANARSTKQIGPRAEKVLKKLRELRAPMTDIQYDTTTGMVYFRHKTARYTAVLIVSPGSPLRVLGRTASRGEYEKPNFSQYFEDLGGSLAPVTKAVRAYKRIVAKNSNR